MIGKLITLGIGDVAEFHMANALHPDNETYDEQGYVDYVVEKKEE